MGPVLEIDVKSNSHYFATSNSINFLIHSCTSITEAYVQNKFTLILNFHERNIKIVFNKILQCIDDTTSVCLYVCICVCERDRVSR